MKVLLVCLVLVAAPTLISAQIANEPGSIPPTDPGGVGGVEEWSIDSVTAFGCDDDAISLGVTFSGLDGVGPYDQQTIAVVAGETYMNQLGNFVNIDGSYGWGIFSDSTGGPIDGTYPMPNDTNVDMQFILYDPTDTAVWQCDVVMDACNSGNIISNACGSPTPTMPRQAMLLLTLVLAILSVIAIRRFA